MSSLPPSLPDERRHDYDALRGFAMLLGIVLHACMAFMGPYWVVHDRNESFLLTAIWAFIHGWRMELFFVLAGYFTAMVLRRDGTSGMMKRRLRRLFIPFLLAAATIAPLTHWISEFAREKSDQGKSGSIQLTEPIHEAVRRSDLPALQRIDPEDPEIGNAQYLAAALGRTQALQALLQRTNGRPAETMLASLHGENALHASIRFGQPSSTKAILDAAHGHAWEPELRRTKNEDGETAAQLAETDERETRTMAWRLGLVRSTNEIKAGRVEALAVLEPGAANHQRWSRWLATLHRPLLHHLWFMWVLIILTLLFGAWAWVNDRWNLPAIPRWMLAEWTRLLWLLPVTTLLFWWARRDQGWGIDGEMSLLEKPASIVFFGFFFAFGAALRLRGAEPARYPWLAWIQLPLLTFVLLPLAFFSAWTHDPVVFVFSCALQAALAWGMTFTLFDLFTAHLAKPNAAVRALADASLWIYIAHLPLVIALQMLVAPWRLWPVVKCGLICSVTFGSLFLVHHFLIRRSWVGLLLNGKKA